MSNTESTAGSGAASPEVVNDRLVTVSRPMVEELAARVLTARGVPSHHIDMVVANLVGADIRGIHTHGIARIPMYLDGLTSGAIDPTAAPAMQSDAPGASGWNGNRAFGQVVMTHLVAHACHRARDSGCHIAVVNNSNHFGYAGHWTRQASDRGAVSLVSTSGGPLVVPTGGCRAEFGTNPLAFGMRGEHDELMVDMSTSTVAMGKLEIAHRRSESIPGGWAVDGEGADLHEPALLIDGMLTGEAGGLLPLGGAGTEHGGHKGYGLGAMVETLTSVLAGGADLRIGRPVPDRFRGQVSHSIIAISVDLLGGDDARAALDRMATGLRSSPPTDPDRPVQVPGDPERRAQHALNDDEISIERVCWQQLQDLASAATADPPPHQTKGATG